MIQALIVHYVSKNKHTLSPLQYTNKVCISSRTYVVNKHTYNSSSIAPYELQSVHPYLKEQNIVAYQQYRIPLQPQMHLFDCLRQAAVPSIQYLSYAFVLQTTVTEGRDKRTTDRQTIDKCFTLPFYCFDDSSHAKRDFDVRCLILRETSKSHTIQQLPIITSPLCYFFIISIST